MKTKINLLLEKIVSIIESQEKGKVLDLGCGDGKTGKRLHDKGFPVEAFDMDDQRFQLKDEIPFKAGSLNNPLPYNDQEFDYCILMEVLEHIYNPDFVIAEVGRILKKGGKLILSTPNILNLNSRFRFLFEGNYDFFREPIMDYAQTLVRGQQNMHVVPWRYQELEYLLFRNGLAVKHISTDKTLVKLFLIAALIKPIILFQGWLRRLRQKKNSIDFSRMDRILLSPELFLGRHLILECQKRT